MSHQDRTKDIVVNHQTIKQVVDRLMPASLFASMKTRSGATWKPRRLAAAAFLRSSLQHDATLMGDRHL